MKSEPWPPVYVAYRRPDFQVVNDLVVALEEALGPPPAGHGNWFFLDQKSTKCGTPWYYSINDAHNAAAAVLGFVSDRSLPKERADYDVNAIYMDEIFLGQISGRLLLVRIDGNSSPLPILGLNQTQFLPWTGTETDTVSQLATTIQSRSSTTSLPAQPSKWESFCREQGHTDFMMDFADPIGPMVIRPIPPLVGNGVIGVTRRAVASDIDQSNVANLLGMARKTRLRLRLPYPREAQEYLCAPVATTPQWRNPFNLAVGPSTRPIWVRDLENLSSPNSVMLGSSLSSETLFADLWFILEDWA